MNGPERPSIFREEAQRRYFQRRVERVLPRLATPSLFRRLWLLSALLMAVVAMIGWAELRAYISAPATLRDGKTPGAEAPSCGSGARR
jgi:hypothetical protein